MYTNRIPSCYKTFEPVYTIFIHTKIVKTYYLIVPLNLLKQKIFNNVITKIHVLELLKQLKDSNEDRVLLKPYSKGC